jgi:hypothetical protein
VLVPSSADKLNASKDKGGAETGSEAQWRKRRRRQLLCLTFPAKKKSALEIFARFCLLSSVFLFFAFQ